MSKTPLVQLKNVGLTYKAQNGLLPILKGVDLEVQPAQTLSIMGPSGAGKTSLLMVLAGLMRPTTGTISIAGHKLHTMSEDARARFRRSHLGIVFQNFHLIPSYTALENVMIPLEFSGAPNSRDEATHWLQAVGLGHRLHHRPSDLSGGEQQRVALARAMVMRPPLILADEPTGNLDRKTGEAITEALWKLVEFNGTSLILVTHDATLAARCQNTLELHDGTLKAPKA